LLDSITSESKRLRKPIQQTSVWCPFLRRNRQNAARYESDPKTGEGRKELAEHAKAQEEERDLAMAKYHHYEVSSAAFQVGIVLAFAAVITGILALAWFAGVLGLAGLVLLALGLYAPHAVALLSAI
jgi:hypothetical protein